MPYTGPQLERQYLKLGAFYPSLVQIVQWMGIKIVKKSNNVGQKPELSIIQLKFPKIYDHYFLEGAFTPLSHPSCVNPNCGTVTCNYFEGLKRLEGGFCSR